LTVSLVRIRALNGAWPRAFSLGLLASAAWPVHAQWWLDVPPAKVPRTASGELDLAAAAPRLPDGHPDLNGVWEPVKTYSRDLADDLHPNENSVPFQPWAKELADARADGSHSRDDPPAQCLPQGVPRLGGAPGPWKLVQTPGLIVIIYESFNLWRQIFTDGRKLAADVSPMWLGYSTGHWDGDTLVVETRGFNGKTWLDQVGKPSTDQLRVIERYRRKDFGHLDIEITIDDPGAYTRPWTVIEHFDLKPDTELLEFVCNENNRDLKHLPSASD
jgi:hypothetical protein